MQKELDEEFISETNVQKSNHSVHTSESLKSNGKTSNLHMEPETDCAWLMLQDTTLQTAPKNLEKWFNHLEVEKLSKNEILFQLVYLVALETGFAEKNAFARCNSTLHFSYVITSFYNWHNVNCLVQQKPKFNSDKSGNKFSIQLRNIISDRILSNEGVDIDAVSINMSAVVTGDLMIVSLTPLHFDEEAQLHSERSICLTIPRYVITTLSKKGKRINECLRNMEELVLQLRNELFVPVRSYQFSFLELDSFPSLLGLPSEAYEKIFNNLDYKQLCCLANTNKLLNYVIVNSKSFEKSKFENDKPFPVVLVKSSTSTIFELDTYY